MPTTPTPRHRAHPWSAIRELNTPKAEPRHADSIIARLGAAVFDSADFAELLRDIGPGNPFKAGAR